MLDGAPVVNEKKFFPLVDTITEDPNSYYSTNWDVSYSTEYANIILVPTAVVAVPQGEDNRYPDSDTLIWKGKIDFKFIGQL